MVQMKYENSWEKEFSNDAKVWICQHSAVLRRRDVIWFKSDMDNPIQPNPTQSNPWIDPTHVHVWFKYNNPVTKLYKLSRQFMPYKHNYYSYTNNYDKANTIVKKISCSDDIDFHFV